MIAWRDGMTDNTPQSFTITWSTDNTCWIATSNWYLYLSGHGDTPQEALDELLRVTASTRDIYVETPDTLSVVASVVMLPH